MYGASHQHKASRVTLILPLLLAATPTAAASTMDATQSLSALTAAAKHWLGATLPRVGKSRTITVQSPDAQLRFPKCPHLSFSLPGGQVTGGRVSVLARCTDPQWQLYLIAQVNSLVPVLVASHALEAGANLAKSDVLRVLRPVQDLPPGAVRSESRVVGLNLKMSLAAGMPLTRSAVRLPDVVQQGDQITIVASGEGVRLSATGIAMENGSVGERILVKNASSGRVLYATVRGKGLVHVAF